MLLEKQGNLQRVLAIQVGTKQDLILTIPALQKLRQLLANTVLTILVSPSAKELGFEMPWLDNILIYEGINDNFKDSKSELTLIDKLRQLAFDASVIFTNPKESPYPLAYICYLAGIPIRISQSQEFGGGVLSHCVKPSHDEFSDRYLFLVESAFQ
jgi:ADP-heptose:LPS heptosyltransferase